MHKICSDKLKICSDKLKNALLGFPVFGHYVLCPSRPINSRGGSKGWPGGATTRGHGPQNPSVRAVAPLMKLVAR